MTNVSSFAQLQLQAGIELPAEKKFYFNGFSIATSTGDFVIVLMQNNQPIVLLNASNSVAKTLHEKIGESIRSFEEQTGQRVMTLDEIGSAILPKGPNE